MVRIKTPKKRLQMYTMFEACLRKALQEMAVNVLQNNVNLGDHDLERLKRYKTPLRQLSSSRTPKTQIRRIVQRGGGPIGLIAQLVASVLPMLLNRNG
jgi:hypothetical protein